MVMLNDTVGLLLAMKKYGVVLYGAGKRGKIAFDALCDKGFSVNAVADRQVGKMIGQMRTVSLEKLCMRSNNEVCIITPLMPLENEKLKLETAYEIVTDFSIINQLLYFFPENSAEINYTQSHPFNHYESPFTSEKELKYNKKMVKDDELYGINLNVSEQRKFIGDMGRYAESFAKIHGGGYYDENNDTFNFTDALLLHSMICHYKPKRIIEIGSGFSTAVMLDADKCCMNDNIDITCIEPYTDRLMSILKNNDNGNITIKQEFVQNIPLKEFGRLEENDILFIDSSHVAKTGGDVPYEYFHILPHLKKGVIIHIHDIFYPFTYPDEWLKGGRPYNEVYILRALLTGSDVYKVLFFNNMMCQLYSNEYEQILKKYNKKMCNGGSIWLRKEK